MKAAELRHLLPSFETERLENGLTLALLDAPGRQVVATALAYRAGTRDESPGLGGTAHFLEHMMFKGTELYAAGELDRITLALGGSNNAFTSHDLTLYHFTFASDRWQRALELEADRMAGLRLEPAEVDAERQVILEEIAMYEAEPWDALEQAVARTLYVGHPYGLPVLGTPEELRAIDGRSLAEFHALRYRPSNAVLVLAGDVGRQARDEVAEHFGGLNGAAPQRAPLPPAAPPAELVRLERQAGDVARLLLALPAPAATDADHPLLRLLLAVLGTGRASRLHRALVDEGQLAVGVSADLGESVDPGAVMIAAEVLPGVEPQRVEEAVLGELERIADEPPSEEEVARTKKVLAADWIFDHERVHQQALLVASSLAVFDAEHPWRYLERMLDAGTAELAEVACRYLKPRRGVVGWSLPAEEGDGLD